MEQLWEIYGSSRNHSDPRMLVFEYEAGYLLRTSQVKLLTKYYERVKKGEYGCVQMKMGQGKTSTIFPLLSLFLSTPERLTVMVVPQPLLSMSEEMLSRSLGGLFERKVTRFVFSREMSLNLVEPSTVKPTLERLQRVLDVLEIARATSSIVPYKQQVR